MPKVQHVLSADQPEFDREFLERLCRLTNQIRRKYGTDREGVEWVRRLLLGRRAMLFFEQVSTRTYLSFEAAAQNMGMDTVEIRDPNTSSRMKGETDMDAFRTFSSYADAIIIRSLDPDLPGRIANHLDTTMRPVPVISAGSGTEHHPTQAFLDIYTLYRSMRKTGGIDHKSIALVGDLLRGRTIHSLCHLLAHWESVHLLLVSPPEMTMPQNVLDYAVEHGMTYEVLDSLDKAIPKANAIYITRAQREYGGVEGEEADPTRAQLPGENSFRFEQRHLDMLQPWAFVMHPLPRTDELDPACDNDQRVMIWRQVRNGMWVRSALLYMLLWKEEELRL